MIIETPRLTLRPFKETDSESWYNLTQEELIKRYLPYAVVTSIQDAKNTLNEYYIPCDFKKDFYLVIESNETHQIIGAIIATTNSSFELEMALITGKDMRHHGYMKEAVKAFCNSIHHKDFVFIVEEDNKPSLSLMRSLGAAESPYDVKGKKRFYIF